MDVGLPGRSGALVQPLVVVGYRTDHEIAPILPRRMVGQTAWETIKSSVHATRTLAQVRIFLMIISHHAILNYFDSILSRDTKT